MERTSLKESRGKACHCGAWVVLWQPTQPNHSHPGQLYPQPHLTALKSHFLPLAVAVTYSSYHLGSLCLTPLRPTVFLPITVALQDAPEFYFVL